MPSVLLVGNFSGWMALHLNHLARAFRDRECELVCADYHKLGLWAGRIKLPGAWETSLRNRNLEKLVRRNHFDLILFVASWKFDLQALRSYYAGAIAIWDLDGLRRATVEDFLKLSDVNLLFSASRQLVGQLQERSCPAIYLASAADCDYYAPITLTERAKEQFTAPLSYIGRATPRRIELCAALEPLGLRVYGDRWAKMPASVARHLDRCNPIRRNVEGRELVEIYNASNATINILQEPLDQLSTILSLQCFAIPASGACLIAEYVEEMPDAFEIGKEVLSFRTAEELTEHAQRCASDRAYAQKIGAAGRRRCLAEHTQGHRVDAILKSLD